MKRLIFLIVIFLTSLGFCAIESGATVDKGDGSIVFYYKVTGDDLAAESSTLVWHKNFSGMVYDVLVIATTTDDDAKVVLSIDPPESPTATQSTTATSFFSLTYTANGFYVIPILDSSSNVYGGLRLSGKVYMQIADTTSATTTSIQVYVFGKLD
jgi:hypothetical protein